MPVSCPICGVAAPEGARFCEVDGARLLADAEYAAAPAAVPPTLAPALPGCRCGAGPEAEADGYCSSCGRKWIAPRKALPRDHVEYSLSKGFGGVTDRGQRHEYNEDDIALSLSQSPAGGIPILVVCDGVSSSDDAQRASAIAAKTACEHLVLAFGVTERSEEQAKTALREAVAAANEAVCALRSSAPSVTSDPAETTFVAAVVAGRTASIAWVGDSRAYWIDETGDSDSLLLTHDHSWMNDMIDTHQMTEEEAQKNRLAHAITRCLGPSTDAESQEPTLATFDFPASGGFLLLCSDGLWNYAPDTVTLSGLVRAATTNDGAVGIARSLVAWANAQGGRDNISAVVWQVLSHPPAPSLSQAKEGASKVEVFRQATGCT